MRNVKRIMLTNTLAAAAIGLAAAMTVPAGAVEIDNNITFNITSPFSQDDPYSADSPVNPGYDSSSQDSPVNPGYSSDSWAADESYQYYEGSWQRAFLEIINNEYSGSYASDFSYALIYVDNDSVPELLVDTNVEAGGNQVYTWHDGMVSKLQTSRLGYSYIDRGNLFENSDGINGIRFNMFYSILNGRWQQVSGIYYDSNQMVTAQYLPKPEMVEKLRTGYTSSVNHKYEIVTEDCTWWEAKRKCEAKGGYLATLTSQEEFDKITNALRNNGMTRYKFYVGASNPKTDQDWGYHWHDPLGEYKMINDTFMPYWLTGEPSYTGEDANKRQVDEECVTLIYLKDGDYYCLNDVAYDLLAQAPYYKGTIGYICEYDNLPAKR